MRIIAALICFVLLAGENARAQSPPQITFTQIAGCGPGGEAAGRDTLAGLVRNLASPQNWRVVLYAQAGDSWWVQPFANDPLTQIQTNGAWSNITYTGRSYAALVVRPDYAPPSRTQALPAVGGAVVAFASTPCRPVNQR